MNKLNYLVLNSNKKWTIETTALKRETFTNNTCFLTPNIIIYNYDFHQNLLFFCLFFLITINHIKPSSFKTASWNQYLWWHQVCSYFHCMFFSKKRGFSFHSNYEKTKKKLSSCFHWDIKKIFNTFSGLKLKTKKWIQKFLPLFFLF